MAKFSTAKTVEPSSLDWLTYLRYLVFRLLLWLTRSSRQARFSKLFDLSSNDPYKYGALPTQQVFDVEWPAKADTLHKANDGLHLFSASANGQIMVLLMTRRADKRATVFLYLRTQKESYVLSKDIYVDHSAEDTFAVDGLRLECIIPLQRWRISFNGLLRNKSTGADDHVRFVFTSNFVTSVADQAVFHSEPLLAMQLARSPKLSLLKTISDPGSINRSLKEIDAIIQSMSYVGKVRVEETASSEVHEEEVFAFGYKKRCREQTSSAVNTHGTLMGYTRNGIFVYLEEVSIKGLSQSLTNGVLVFPSFLHLPIENASLNVMKQNDICRGFTLGCGSLPSMELTLDEELDTLTFNHEFHSETRKRTARVFRMTFDTREGYAVFFGALRNRVEVNLLPIATHIREPIRLQHGSGCNIVSFENRLCADANFTGGKASSLAILTSLAKDCEKFEVAKGLAVTTVAYDLFTKQYVVAQAVQQLEDTVRAKTNMERLKNVCQQVVNTIGSAAIPFEIKDDLNKELSRIFGADFKSKRFAVRSSAVGEDSEEMSAAGQMETFLGCRGLDEITRSIAKCWASQFSFVALQYRRRYGQEINCRMSVCVQEMVASEVSGVMFTVDPVTCNPKFITITANYGLGESVVSATADPDTFILEKSGEFGARLVSSTLGSKKLRTVMDDSGGIRNLKVADSEAQQAQTQACLNEDQLKKLGEVARLIENHYASQRDTEWAFAPGGQKLVLLQARPVTSAHRLDTDFEFYHETDAGVTSEYDCLSKANVGEVFGGSVSPLTLEVSFRCFTKLFKEMRMRVTGQKIWDIMFARDQFFFTQNSQCFFATFSPVLDYTCDDIMSRGFSISMAGRIINDDIVKTSAANKRRYLFQEGRPNFLSLIKDMWNAEGILDEAEKVVQESNITFDDCKDSREILHRIMANPHLQEHALNGHSKQIYYGTIFNVFVLAMLSKAEGGWTQRVFGDFAKVVASCNNLVSADVPQMLAKISHEAGKDYGEEFKRISPEKALEKLKSDKTKTAELFAVFLQKHGHRCLHEFDLASRPWAMNPLPVVTTIQEMLGTADIAPKRKVSVEELVDSMEIKMSLWKQRILRFLLHRVRNGIANRERAKSNLIMSSHKYRMMFRTLANRLVYEGRLPDPDLIFFLLPNEIMQLITTRSSKIIVRAIHRKKNQLRASKDIYPEHSTGLPFKPVNMDPPGPEVRGLRRINGTPVAQGIVVASCRVVICLDDAHQIQPGDILITYATDIGWSPYFPMLSGIVTELGGLISHGAVVAREYGLPCIVAAHGATKLFHSGEKVLLDGNKGFLQTVDEDQEKKD